MKAWGFEGFDVKSQVLGPMHGFRLRVVDFEASAVGFEVYGFRAYRGISMHREVQNEKGSQTP